ncbi:hypothetical protein [Klebsiella variicola]
MRGGEDVRYEARPLMGINNETMGKIE